MKNKNTRVLNIMN